MVADACRYIMAANVGAPRMVTLWNGPMADLGSLDFGFSLPPLRKGGQPLHTRGSTLSLRRARDLTEGSSEDKSQRQNTHRMVALGNAHALLRGEGYPSPRGGAVGYLSDNGRRWAAADALRRQLPHLSLLPRTFHSGREPESLRHLFLYRARTGHTPHAAFWPARRFMSIAGPARLLNPPGALPY